MKLFATLALLVFIVLLCDKYEQRLPPPMSWIYALWKKFSHVLGIVMSFLILTVLWIIGFGSYAIIIKILNMRHWGEKKPDTYWIDVEPTTIESMKHQF